MADATVRRFLRQVIVALGRQTPAFVGGEQSRPAVVRALGRSSPAYSGSAEEAEWQRLVDQLGDPGATAAEPPAAEPPAANPPTAEPPPLPSDPGADAVVYYRDRDLLVTGSLVIAGGRRFAVADITSVRLARSTRPWVGFVAVMAPLLTGVALALATRGGLPLWISLMGLLCFILAAPLLIGRLTGRDLLEVWIEYRGATVRLTRARSVPHARFLFRVIQLVMRLRGQNATV